MTCFDADAAAPPVAFDMVRLFLNPISVGPRGIDRVDLAYARFFAEQWPGEFGGVLPTIRGFRWFDRRHVLRWIDLVDTLWQESIEAFEDPMLAQVKRRMCGATTGLSGGPTWRPRSRVARIEHIPKLLSLSNTSRAGRLIKSLPTGAIYLNVGQIGLAMEWLLSWLEQRRDIKPIFMLHDMIPLENPELVSRRSHHYHGRMLDNAVQYAAGLITTTQSASTSVLRAFNERNKWVVPVQRLPLPVPKGFLSSRPRDEELSQQQYFVVCGSIERRKNHLLLLDVWRSLILEHGSQAPKLVVIGSPGWGARAIVQALSRHTVMRDHIIVVSGLSTPGLCSLLANARALLMPSLAEGFGLPIIEALTLGTPVVVSDIPAHRETAGQFGIYCNPADQKEWLAIIRRLTFEPDWVAELRRGIAAYRPLTANEYFADICGFVREVHAAVPGWPRPPVTPLGHKRPQRSHEVNLEDVG